MSRPAVFLVVALIVTMSTCIFPQPAPSNILQLPAKCWDPFPILKYNCRVPSMHVYSSRQCIGSSLLAWTVVPTTTYFSELLWSLHSVPGLLGSCSISALLPGRTVPSRGRLCPWVWGEGHLASGSVLAGATQGGKGQVNTWSILPSAMDQKMLGQIVFSFITFLVSNYIH